MCRGIEDTPAIPCGNCPYRGSILKAIKNPAVVIKKARDKGKKIFQPNLISWSYLYRGYATRTQINKNNTNTVFNPNHKNPGIHKNPKPNNGYQPPKNKIVVKLHIKSILALSPRKNKAKPILEYSMKYPATSSASASGKSNGCLFVSAKADTKNITNKGKRGIQNQTSFWAKTISVRFKEPTHKITLININPIDTS